MILGIIIGAIAMAVLGAIPVLAPFLPALSQAYCRRGIEKGVLLAGFLS